MFFEEKKHKEGRRKRRSQGSHQKRRVVRPFAGQRVLRRKRLKWTSVYCTPVQIMGAHRLAERNSSSVKHTMLCLVICAETRLTLRPA